MSARTSGPLAKKIPSRVWKIPRLHPIDGAVVEVSANVLRSMSVAMQKHDGIGNIAARNISSVSHGTGYCFSGYQSPQAPALLVALIGDKDEKENQAIGCSISYDSALHD